MSLSRNHHARASHSHEIHLIDCDCAVCEPYRPSVPERLHARALAKLTIAGIVAGHLVAAAVTGPGHVLRTIASNLGGWPL